MAVESASDRAAMLADFGVSITYTLAGGGVSTIVGIYDSPADDFSGFPNAPGMIRQAPRFACRAADLPGAAAQGDSVAVAGVATAYRVTEILRDGTGFAQVNLEQAS